MPWDLLNFIVGVLTLVVECGVLGILILMLRRGT